MKEAPMVGTQVVEIGTFKYLAQETKNSLRFRGRIVVGNYPQADFPRN